MRRLVVNRLRLVLRASDLSPAPFLVHLDSENSEVRSAAATVLTEPSLRKKLGPVTLKRINDYVAEATMKHAGKVVATTRRLITDNGKTLILIYQETDAEHPVDNIIVYDHRP